MNRIAKEAEAILRGRFGGDSILALATAEDGMPHVRSVNAFYWKGAFYVLTHSLSGKMRQIRKNPTVALAGDWFTAHGRAADLGWFGSGENRELARKMRQIFAAWIDNGHSDLSDRNTIILQIELTDGLLLSHGRRYEL